MMIRRCRLQMLALSVLLTATTATAVAADRSTVVHHYVIGSPQDPRVLAAQFRDQRQQFWDAAADLLSVEASAPGVQLPATFNAQLADSLLAVGIPQRGETLGAAPSDRRKESLQAGRAQIDLASQLYAHGDYTRALQLLQGLRYALPDRLFVPWQDLMSRLYLRLDRPKDAVTALTKPDNDSDQTPFERYNLAVALLRSHRVKDGLTVFNQVGRMDVVDSDTLALRDKANLVLGYWYLRHQQGSTAVKVFQRVRLVGPFSNRALLGMGWAELAVRGQQQRPTNIDSTNKPDPYASLSNIGALIRPGFLDEVIDRDARLRALRSLQLHDAPTDKEIALKRALVPWSVLLSRDPMDPGVQECMLAVPYALDQIGAHIEAEEYYQRAVKALQQTRARLAQAKRNIASDRMVDTIIKRDADAQTGWRWRMTDLPDAVETFYLQHTLAAHPYQSTIKDFRDLRRLQRLLKRQDATLAALQSGSPPKYYLQAATRHQNLPRLNSSDQGPGLKLHMSDQLGQVGSSDAAGHGNAASVPDLPLLALSQTPPQFHNDAQRITALRARIAALQPKVTKAIAAEDQRLKAIALDELDIQDKTATKYLVQTRFALARLYDHGGGDGNRSDAGDQP